MPPVVPTGFHVDRHLLRTVSLEHDARLDADTFRCRTVHRLVRVALQIDGLAAAEHAVTGDQEVAVAVDDPVGQ